MSDELHKTQKLQDGYGATYRRLYSFTVAASEQNVNKAMQDLKSDLNRFSPQILARFEKVTGDRQKLREEDEYMIHISGPWDGPVRVKDVTDHSFRLVTLDGHLEAGEITFEMVKKNNSEHTFEIRSLARSRDAIVDFVYDKIPIAKAAQTEMWTEFCQNFAKHILDREQSVEYQGRAKDPEIHVLTERRDEETGQWKKL